MKSKENPDTVLEEKPEEVEKDKSTVPAKPEEKLEELNPSLWC